VAKRIEIRILHCSACGAPIADQARRCDHCRAPISPKQRELDRVCLGCGSRMSSRGCYCAHCGAPTPEQSITPLPENRRCPRCAGELKRRDFATGRGGAALVECGVCAGIRLTPSVFDHLCRRAEAAALTFTGLLPDRRPKPFHEEVVRYLPCPECGVQMARRNWGGDSGVVVDCCVPHGLWFDHDELARVVDYLRGGGSEGRKRAIAAARATDLHARQERMRKSGEPQGEIGVGDGEQVVFDVAVALAGFLASLWKDLFRDRRPPPSVVLTRSRQVKSKAAAFDAKEVGRRRA
jgi:Zn-finger nucleic acid-binding protein